MCVCVCVCTTLHYTYTPLHYTITQTQTLTLTLTRYAVLVRTLQPAAAWRRLLALEAGEQLLRAPNPYPTLTRFRARARGGVMYIRGRPDLYILYMCAHPEKRAAASGARSG